MSFLDKMERELLEEAMKIQSLDSKFVTKLMNYLESVFPSYGEFSQNINTELKKVVPVGDEEKMKEFGKVKKKIHDIVTKAKQKFLNDVEKKVTDLKISTGVQEEEVEPTEDIEDGNDRTSDQHRHNPKLHSGEENRNTDNAN